MHRGLCLFVLVGVVGSLELREYPLFFHSFPQFEIYIKQYPEIKRVVLSAAVSSQVDYSAFATKGAFSITAEWSAAGAAAHV
jgi:hypothetical protein